MRPFLGLVQRLGRALSVGFFEGPVYPVYQMVSLMAFGFLWLWGSGIVNGYGIGV